MLEQLEITRKIAESFLTKSPSVFSEVDAFVAAFDLDGYKLLPVFEPGHFNFDLRLSKEMTINGSLLAAETKLDRIAFLAYVIDSDPA